MAERRAACVIGWPIGHSRSPLIHNYWIKEHGHLGANVTVPHKEAVLALSEPDERARAIGAANTLWLEGGRLRATNTDVEGFIANLDATAPGWDRGLGSTLVLGAGGAARAVIFGLLERGI